MEADVRDSSRQVIEGRFSPGCYQAVEEGYRAADGAFVTAVRTTGIYCRPTCAARIPLAKNVVFYSASGAAEAAGFRACKRCRPEIMRTPST